MYFLGIDPSTVSTGYCVMDKDKNIIESNKITLNKNDSAEVKIHTQMVAINEIFNRYKISKILCEDQFHGMNVMTLKQLCRVSGAIIYVGMTHGLSVELIYPSSWRKRFHGSGKNSKRDSFDHAVKKYNLKGLKFTKDNDLTDSIGIAWACVDLAKEDGLI